MSKLIVELPEHLHASLKKHAAMEHKTLKVIVTSLLSQYLTHPGQMLPRTTTTLCGAWKDRRAAEALVADIRAARRWRIGARG
ncbi:MAG: hypothetical protein HYY15_04490 [Candidatus Omnitrophica bacterium]|nr:hypothetical protein [Candidatus Omnitrophota bacterium]